MTRQGDWMQTYSGRQFWPIDPRPEEIFIEDIAHSLSMQCRYAGHCLRFYSVAEHSVLLARHVAQRFKLWALLHDAGETYLLDVIRPLKPSLPGYKVAEQRVMAAVCERFGLPPQQPLAVSEADNAILADEQQQNMAPCAAPWTLFGGPLGITLQFWSPDQAKAEFLAEYERLAAVGAAA